MNNQQNTMNNQQNITNEFELYYYFKLLYRFQFKRQKRTYSKRHCPICYNLIRKNNVVLNCTHNCCFSCFEKFLHKSYYSYEAPICFICRGEIHSLEVKQLEHKKAIQKLSLEEEPKKLLILYPNITRIPGRKVIYILLQYFFICFLIFHTFEFVKLSIRS